MLSNWSGFLPEPFAKLQILFQSKTVFLKNFFAFYGKEVIKGLIYTQEPAPTIRELVLAI